MEHGAIQVHYFVHTSFVEVLTVLKKLITPARLCTVHDGRMPLNSKRYSADDKTTLRLKADEGTNTQVSELRILLSLFRGKG